MFKCKENTSELLVTQALARQVAPDCFKCFSRGVSITSKEYDLTENTFWPQRSYYDFKGLLFWSHTSHTAFIESSLLHVHSSSLLR